MEQTTRLNRRKLKRAPWKRMTLGKAMKIMMTEKTSYKSLEDSPDVCGEFWTLVVQCQSRTKLLPAEVQLDVTRWKWSCCMINTRTKEMAIASSISSGSPTGYEGYQLLSSDWSRNYATHVFFRTVEFCPRQQFCQLTLPNNYLVNKSTSLGTEFDYVAGGDWPGTEKEPIKASVFSGSLW